MMCVQYCLIFMCSSLFGASVDQTPPTAADSKVEDHHADLADSILPKSGDLSPWSYSDPYNYTIT